MVADIGRDAATRGLPISGIGGITTWRDAAEYIALGAGTVQVCTAAMAYGFKIVQDMVDGLANYMDGHGHANLEGFRGKALPTVTEWQHLNLAYTEKAVIDQSLCIQCGRCHIACEDTSHQAISATKAGKRWFEVNEAECVGCNLCPNVCPVPGCITMRALAPGEIDQRTGRPVSSEPLPWTRHANNPTRQA
jgi:dihydropyrimidine dehydrogenase (NAD+) subunit PreA